MCPQEENGAFRYYKIRRYNSKSVNIMIGFWSRKLRIQPWGSLALATQDPLSSTFDTNFDDKRQFFGWYSSLED
jgi:hypothetical protein